MKLKIKDQITSFNMIWLLEYKKEPGRMNYITDVYISGREKQEDDYGINPKFYSTEKELFRYEVIKIIKLRQSGMLSNAYDDVLNLVDGFVEISQNKYPELLI